MSAPAVPSILYVALGQSNNSPAWQALKAMRAGNYAEVRGRHYGGLPLSPTWWTVGGAAGVAITELLTSLGGLQFSELWVDWWQGESDIADDVTGALAAAHGAKLYALLLYLKAQTGASKLKVVMHKVYNNTWGGASVTNMNTLNAGLDAIAATLGTYGATIATEAWTRDGGGVHITVAEIVAHYDDAMTLLEAMS